MSSRVRGIAAACAAAVLFGITTPLAKLLLGSTGPLLLAALLYLGAGIGVTVQRKITGAKGGAPVGRDRRVVVMAIIAGGVVAPVLQMLGLDRMPAASAALLLNAESALTVVLAWAWFGEHIGRRVALGMVLVLSGVVLLSAGDAAGVVAGWAPLAVLAACACWAVDNNLTRSATSVDPTWLASVKGFGAGLTNLLLCLAIGGAWPSPVVVFAALLLGAFGYGISLTLFINALRALGAARTSAYFALAPFVGAAVALQLGSAAPRWFWIGGLLVTAGVLLDLTEHHEHWHQHQLGGISQEHAHAHYPDAEHRHGH